MRDEGDFNMQQMDDEIDIAMNEAFDNAAMDSGNLVKLDENFRLRLNAAATPRLGSTQLGLDKHEAAVIINKEMKTKISKFPRSH